MSHQVTRIATRSAFLELAAGAPGAMGATGATEVVSKTATQTPTPTHAGGQDDGSLNKLPQIIQGKYFNLIKKKYLNIIKKCASQARNPPSTHARGQDDGSYTNFLK